MTHIQAIVRTPARSLAEGERTHLGRAPVDFTLALAQHAAYVAALETMGLAVNTLLALPDLHDACFVEDVLIALPEVAILTRPGAPSRADEPRAIVSAAPSDRPLAVLTKGRLDGGDVLVIGRRIFVGLSSRTDADGAAALGDVVHHHGYAIEALAVPSALHLKTALTAIGETLVVNRAWIEPPAGYATVDAHPEEPFGANLLWANGHALAQAAAPRTAERVRAAGFDVTPVDISEFAKAEAGLTCLSVLVPVRAAG